MSNEMNRSAMPTQLPVLLTTVQVCVVPGIIRISKAVVIDSKSG
jgi:hypothetical protein